MVSTRIKAWLNGIAAGGALAALLALGAAGASAAGDADQQGQAGTTALNFPKIELEYTALNFPKIKYDYTALNYTKITFQGGTVTPPSAVAYRAGCPDPKTCNDPNAASDNAQPQAFESAGVTITDLLVTSKVSQQDFHFVG